MTGPLRVERALQLLPDVEILEPLRIQLLGVGETEASRRWSSAGPYQTVGKRGIDIETLRNHVERVLPRLNDHVTTLYNSYLRALEAWHQGDGATAAGALVEAGDAELRMRRLRQAVAWFDVAFRVAAELGDRAPEMDVLGRLGNTSIDMGRTADAGRFYQRMLALAESGFNHDAVIVACHGLGRTSIERQAWEGASAWCLRGLRHTSNGDYPLRTAQLESTLALASWKQGDIDDALQRLRHARDVCEIIDASVEMARVLGTRGRLEMGIGKADAAVATLREALAWTRRPDVDGALRVEMSIALSDAHAAAGNPGEAERELRSAEQLAVDGRLIDRLAEVYVGLGRLCVPRRDETGFVFFEQAIALCAMASTGDSLEARVYEAYGLFRLAFGHRDEASAHLTHSAALFAGAGDEVSTARLRKELAALPA